MTLANAYLREDPFLVVPPRPDSRIVWADQESLKRQLEDLILRYLESGVSSIVVNRGPYGSGKSHAAAYFSRSENLPQSARKDLTVTSVVLQCPSNGTSAVEEFYEDLLLGIGWDTLRERFIGIRQSMGPTDFVHMVQSIVPDPDLVAGFNALGDEDSDETTVRTFFLGGNLTAPERRELEVSRSIRLISQRMRVSPAIISIFNRGHENNANGRFILWIDETEDMTFYLTRHKRDLNRMWRRLLENNPSGLLILLNFTPYRGQSDESSIYEPYILERRSANIIFDWMTLDNAQIYLRDLLNADAYRVPLPKGVVDTYPFAETAIDNILNRIGQLSPRVINIACGEVMRRALSDEVLETTGNRLIESEYVEVIWPEVAEGMAFDTGQSGLDI